MTDTSEQVPAGDGRAAERDRPVPGRHDPGPRRGHDALDPDATQRPGARTVPAVLDAVAAWSWRILLIGILVFFVVQFSVRVGLVVLALLVGLLFTALMRPGALWLERRTPLNRLAATWVVLVAAVAVALAVLFLIQQRFTAQLPMLRQNLAGGINRLRDLLVQQFGLDPQRIDQLRANLVDQVMGVGQGAGAGSSPLVSGVTTLVAVLAGLALALFTAFWLVYQGEKVGAFLVDLVPRRWRPRAGAAGERAWETLGGYLRGVTLVALIDAVGIGLALVLLGVPLAFTLALITFLGAYIPIVGAFVAGLAAVLVALAANGLTDALLVLAAVIVVQQLEGNVLQPIIMGRTVRLHPLAIGYALTVGGVLYGIGGALLAVPLAAVIHAVACSLRETSHDGGPEDGSWRDRLTDQRRRLTRRRGSGQVEPAPD